MSRFNYTILSPLLFFERYNFLIRNYKAFTCILHRLVQLLITILNNFSIIYYISITYLYKLFQETIKIYLSPFKKEEKVDKKINIINRTYIFEHSHNFLSALRIYSPSLSLTNWISTTRLLSFFAKLLRSSFSLLPVFLDDQRDWSSSHRISIFPFSIFQAFSLRSLLFVAEVILYSTFPLLFAYHLLLPSNKNHCVTTIHTFFFSFFSFPFFFSTNHEKRLFSFSSIFDIRFVSFPVAPLISRLIFVLQNFGFSFQWRNCQLLLDLNNGRLCAAIVVFTEFLLLRFRLIFPEFFRSERIFSRESLHVSYNF